MANKKDKSIHDVRVPAKVTAQMQDIAKYYVTNRLKDGFTMQDMFKRFSISSKTYYNWLKEVEGYEEYITKMSDILIPDDELEAVRKFRKKVMQYADKDNLSSAEMKLFMDMFNPIIEADNRLQMQKLGLNTESKAGKDSDQRTIEEKKSILLQRLQPTERKGVND